jgi:hypothetical protein
LRHARAVPSFGVESTSLVHSLAVANIRRGKIHRRGVIAGAKHIDARRFNVIQL